jgi:hypothetical protein
MADLVCLLRTPSLEEAMVVESLLNAHGIPAILGEAERAKQQWHFMPIGGIRVLVPVNAMQDGLDIIHRAIESADEDLALEFGCFEQTRGRRDRFQVWVYFLFPLGGFVLLPLAIGLIYLERYKRHAWQSVNKKNPEPKAPGQF